MATDLEMAQHRIQELEAQVQTWRRRKSYPPPDDSYKAGYMECVAQVAALQAENERLRTALTRLVELGNDDGSAPDDAWKQAWTEAARALD